MSIITRRGDSGVTDLLFGKRSPKTSRRVEALGCVDELNASLGLARAAGSSDDDRVAIIDGVQARLVGLMGQLACAPGDEERYVEKGYATLGRADVDWLEMVAKDHESRGVRFTDWARPGAEGSLARAAIDFARTAARRAERAVLGLHESGEPVAVEVRLFFNRLSDLLWILARRED